jgi:Protein of unknown function (DUF2750)
MGSVRTRGRSERAPLDLARQGRLPGADDIKWIACAPFLVIAGTSPENHSIRSGVRQFEPYEVSWTTFSAKWVPGMTKDGLLVGVNWTGPQALGYDVTPEEVRIRVEFEKGRSPNAAG